MQVRNGFSLFPEGQDQGVSGLGSDLNWTDWLATQSKETQDYVSSYATAHPGDLVSTALATSSTSWLSDAPKSLWVILGGFVAVAFLMPAGRR